MALVISIEVVVNNCRELASEEVKFHKQEEKTSLKVRAKLRTDSLNISVKKKPHQQLLQLAFRN